MTTIVRTLTPVIDAAPGEIVLAELEIQNTGAAETSYIVTVVGLEAKHTATDDLVPPAAVVVPAKGVSSFEIPVQIPTGLGVGQHSAAFSVEPTQPGERVVLSPFTVSIASVERVLLEPFPSVVRGHRAATFMLEASNREAEPVAFTLDGEAAEVRVRFDHSTFQLRPGELARTKARLKAPRQWFGEPIQHNILITARGRAATTSITTPFIQRPVFAHRLLAFVAAFAVVALWLAAIGGGYLWWTGRDDGTNNAGSTSQPTEDSGSSSSGSSSDSGSGGSGSDDTGGSGGSGSDDSGSGGSGSGGTSSDDSGSSGSSDSGSDGSGGGGSDDSGSSDSSADDSSSGDDAPAPQSASDESSSDDASSDESGGGTNTTSVRGSITTDGGGDVDDIQIRLAPIQLGEEPQSDGESQAVGFRSTQRSSKTKLWSARFNRLDTGLNPIRQTEPIDPLETNPEADGVWRFSDVLIGQSYELVFSKPGYDTQSYVVTPDDEGNPIERDIELKPAVGALDGTIFGPSGPLGGVTITITDGILNFSTTSETVDAVGGWGLTGISTPGIYTIEAALHGFGTEVLQVELEAGEQLTGIDLTMQAGVGSIGGRVTDVTGAPLGGVSITATSGDDTITTTSLTEGNIGSYLLPRLLIPGTYTVTAELDDHITETRRLPLRGAVGNVNFTMRRTTGTLTGMVLSGKTGLPITGAGITLRNGDLEFRTVSATKGTKGSFTVQNLPPGSYAVTFEHHEHSSATELVTIEEGRFRELIVTLDKASPAEALEPGTLIIKVQIGGGDPTNRPDTLPVEVTIKEALTLKEIEGSPFEGDGIAEVTIPDLKAGTYVIDVTADDYNPVRGVRVSVGPGNVTKETVTMFKLGSARGRLVDSVTGDQITTPYNITLTPEFRDAQGTTQGPQKGPYGSLADGTWQTGDRDLAPGVWLVSFLVDDHTPLGYEIPTDQILEPGLPAPNTTMRFIVEGGGEPVEVADIMADPYPRLTGTIFEPLLNGSTTSFEHIDDPTLTIDLACDGSHSPPAQDLLAATDAGQTLLESFVIEKEQVDEFNLTGNCAVTASATGYTSGTQTLPNIAASSNPARVERSISMAIAKPANPVTGTVFWIDPAFPGVDRLLPDVMVSTTATVGFDETLDDLTAPPKERPGVLNAGPTDTTGAWTIDGHVFGSTEYRFEHARFNDGTITVAIDENQVRTATAGTFTTVKDPSDQTSVDVKLTEPFKGQLSGRVDIFTSKAAADTAGVGVTITDPAGAAPDAADVTRTDAAKAVTFSVANASAGTWQVDFGLPDNHALFDTGTATVTGRIEPGTPNDTFNTEFVELGTIDVGLTDSATGNAVTSEATLKLSGHAVQQESFPTADAASDRYLLDRIVVGAANPATVPVSYTLDLDVTGFDTATATVTIDGALQNVSVTGDSIPLTMLAGQTRTIQVSMPKYGSISGSVLGDLGLGATPETVDLTAPLGDLKVTPVDELGIELTGTLPPAPLIDANADGTFSISGPVGWYRIEPSHDQYKPTPASIPPDPQNTGLQPAGVFRMLNNTPNVIAAPFILDIRTGALDLTVLTSIDPVGTPVGDAQYFIYQAGVTPPAAAPCTTSPPQSGVQCGSVAADGTADITGLVPGDYRLDIRRFVGGVEESFPVITTFTIGRSTAGNVHTATVRAPLPPLRPAVTGVVEARNVDGALAPLPPSVILTGDYTEPQIEVDDALVNNAASGDGSLTIDTGNPAADIGTIPYTFNNLPYGTHTVTAGTVPDYTAPDPEQIVVSAAGPNPGPTFTYRVATADVIMVLDDGSTDAAYPDIDASLVSSTNVSYTSFTFEEASNKLTIHNVQPELGKFELTLSDDLHSDLTDFEVTVPMALVDDGGTDVRNAGTITMTATKARVTGDVGQKESTGTVDLGPGGKVELLGAGDVVVESKDGPTGDYEFDVAAASYTIRVSRTGYETKRIPVDLTGKAGQITPLDVFIDKQAAVPISVAAATGTVPGDVTIVLVNQNTFQRHGPEPGPTFTFTVPAGTYLAEARSASYGPTVFADSSITVAVGDNAPLQTITLPRRLTVSVTGAPSASIEVLTAGGTSIATKPAPAVFTSADSSPLPTSNSLLIRATSTGYRARQVTEAAALNPSVSIAMLGDLTVSGTIQTAAGVAASDGTITATAPGGLSRSGMITGGAYSIAGLTTDSDGDDLLWTITYDEPGVGMGGTTILVKSDAPTAGTGNPITLMPQEVAVRVRVTSGGGVGGATVSLDGETRTTLANGRTELPRINVLESNFSTILQVDHTNFLRASDALSTFFTGTIPTSREILVTVPMTARPPVSGTVTRGGTNVTGVTVTICAQPTTTPCGSPLGTDTTGGSGFSIPITLGADTYDVWAEITSGNPAVTERGKMTVTVNADNSLTGTPLTIPLAVVP